MSRSGRPPGGLQKSPGLIISTPELKDQLREIAFLDFDKFFEILGLDELQIFICADRANSKTLQQITNRLKTHGIELTRSAVAARCKKCKKK